MPVASTTLAGVNVWRLSGNVTDAELRTAWAGLIVNNRYLLARTLYIDDTCSLVNVRGTYYIDSQNLGVILHLSRNKANTLFRNWFFTQTVGLSVGARSNFVRFTNGTTITNSTSDGIDMQGGGMMYAVVGNPGGGDPRFLNEMMFGSLDGTLVTSAAWTEQEIEPTSIGTIWRGLNVQKAAGYPILSAAGGLQRQVVYRSNFNTEGANLRLIRPYFNNSLCYVSSTVRRQGATVTANLFDTFGSSGAAVIMMLNNWLDESWFGASKTALTGANWNAGNRAIGGVMKKILVQPSTVIRTYDSRSTTTSQKSTFSETTNDFLTGAGTTNLLLHSEAIDNAAWEKGAITVTANNTTAPDGTMTADRLVEVATTAQHRTSNVTSIGVIAGVAHTFSFYAKPSGRNHVHSRIITGGTNVDAQAVFNLVNGTFLASAGTTATITDVGDGWFRCTLSAVLTANSAVCFANLATTTSLTVPSYAGNINNGVFFWGAQFQEGTAATQYLQTTTSRADGYYTTVSDAVTGRAQFVSVGGIATGGSLSITRFTGQRFTLQKFGFRVQVETPDMTFGDDDLSAFSPITMTAQTGITRTQAAIAAATSIDTFQQLLEELHVLAIGLQGAASYSAFGGGNLFNYEGGVLTTNFASVVVDATAASKIVYNSTTNTLTIKSATLAATNDVTRWNNPSGTINLANGAVIQGLYSSSEGDSSIVEIVASAGSSIYLGNNATGVTRLFMSNVLAGSYRVYFPPGENVPKLVARELYGFQRFAEVVTPNGNLITLTPVDTPDVGITEQDLATVQAYTAIETTSKFYDRTAAFRLTEQGIKLGQMVARSGTALEIGNFSHLINKDASLVYAVAGSAITTKSTSYAGDSRYQTEIAIPPATITANTTEVITVNIEDANGNSQISINGGDGEFELWKVTTSTPTANYTDGTLLDTVGNGIYRFIGVSGFDIVGVDTNSNIRRRTSMGKGVYTQAFYVGDQIQLAQAPEVTEINTKVDVMQIALNAVQAKTNNLPASPAAVGDAMTLTTAYDAAKSAATQASVDALGEPLQVGDVVDANIVKVNNVDVDGTGTEADPWGPT